MLRGRIPPPFYRPNFENFGSSGQTSNSWRWILPKSEDFLIKKGENLKILVAKWGREPPTQHFIIKCFHFRALLDEPICTTRDLSLGRFRNFRNFQIFDLRSVIDPSDPSSIPRFPDFRVPDFRVPYIFARPRLQRSTSRLGKEQLRESTAHTSQCQGCT